MLVLIIHWAMIITQSIGFSILHKGWKVTLGQSVAAESSHPSPVDWAGVQTTRTLSKSRWLHPHPTPG